VLAEGREGERLQGLVQTRQLPGDPQQRVLRVEPPVERAQLVADRVQMLEQRVELAVLEERWAPVHRGILETESQQLVAGGDHDGVLAQGGQ
jgi:hypothetical protein